MKIVAFAAAASLALSAAALAQTPAPTTPRQPATPTAPAPVTPAPPSPSAMPSETTGSTTRAAVNSAPLENGANSFTEQQAMMRLRDAGITDVTGLAKDNNGVWRGRGTWQGRSVAVGLDYRGHIAAR
jgi:glucose/arabinose dehydrogenase